jgi:hypothetical protein
LHVQFLYTDPLIVLPITTGSRRRALAFFLN